MTKETIEVDVSAKVREDYDLIKSLEFIARWSAGSSKLDIDRKFLAFTRELDLSSLERRLAAVVEHKMRGNSIEHYYLDECTTSHDLERKLYQPTNPHFKREAWRK